VKSEIVSDGEGLSFSSSYHFCQLSNTRGGFKKGVRRWGGHRFTSPPKTRER